MKVLVADDAPEWRRLLRAEIEGLGHDCVVAADGEEAWARFQETRPEVVISDSLMPGLDGPELCCRIRRDSDAPYTYFVLLSAQEGLDFLARGMQAGADDCLTKPLHGVELAVRLIAAERVTALHRRLVAQQEQLRRLTASLHEDARSDPLTGVGNRRRLDEDLTALAGRVERYGHAYAVALFDIDRFKRYNDAWGHPAGDDVLRRVAETLVAEGRRGDGVYRYGGEEFAVLFAEQGLEPATQAAERMRASIERLRIAHPASEAGLVTVSAGIAALRPSDASDPHAALHRADDALYRAKAAGRNRVASEP